MISDLFSGKSREDMTCGAERKWDLGHTVSQFETQIVRISSKKNKTKTIVNQSKLVMQVFGLVLGHFSAVNPAC